MIELRISMAWSRLGLWWGCKLAESGQASTERAERASMATADINSVCLSGFPASISTHCSVRRGGGLRWGLVHWPAGSLCLLHAAPAWLTGKQNFIYMENHSRQKSPIQYRCKRIILQTLGKPCCELAWIKITVSLGPLYSYTGHWPKMVHFGACEWSGMKAPGSLECSLLCQYTSLTPSITSPFIRSNRDPQGLARRQQLPELVDAGQRHFAERKGFNMSPTSTDIIVTGRRFNRLTNVLPGESETDATLRLSWDINSSQL